MYLQTPGGRGSRTQRGRGGWRRSEGSRGLPKFTHLAGSTPALGLQAWIAQQRDLPLPLC